MPEQRSPLKEFRHLDEKLKTVGLSPAEQGRYDQLKEIVSPEVAAPRPGFDVNAAAEALRASLEPAGPRRPGRPAAEAGPFDLAAEPALGAARHGAIHGRPDSRNQTRGLRGSVLVPERGRGMIRAAARASAPSTSPRCPSSEVL